MTIQARHRRIGHRWWPAVVLGFVVAAIVGAAGFIGWGVAGDPPHSPVARNPGTSTAGDSTTTTADGAATDLADAANAAASTGTSADDALNACRALFSRQVRAALAADASLDQWRLHIDAMNQLVAGEITLTQASRYWERTRVGARSNVSQFRELDAVLRGSSLRCTRPSSSAGTATGSNGELRNCRAATSRFAASLGAARVTLRTWVHHIRDMEDLRAGLITPEEATTMWTLNWHVGARQLKIFDRLAAKALVQDC